MEAGSDPSEEQLLQRPWLPVSISGCQLLVKSCFSDTAYRILLTDMHCVWEERMEAAAIQSRAQELNRRLRASVEAFFSHLCEVVQPCLSGGELTGGKAQIFLTRQDNGNINVRLKSELAELPFYWEFRCSPAPVALACAQLVRPLLVISRMLQQQVKQLGGLLVRKDAEIQDYRENGATLSRERLQTEVFEESTYREHFMATTLPFLWSESLDSLGFDADLQQLYTTAIAHRKRKLSEERSVQEEQPAAESSADVVSARSEAANIRKQNHNKQDETTDVKTTNRPTMPKSDMSIPAERKSSKAKKKKVGLFR
ncbi:non-homologous end-joining factor 1 [Austrofundulus limnaeus]|uniref:Non-homologous end-joining factor 1 n=1 Tax=Austrofundulus limnaeus TaxID=52670 RepID=A0A2I4CB58_AUSLI|nr:PREDICTED: non-homologous end-joining factor 1 [Austrofundulus limnaeus]XP_013877228.1 PREDICTED: non-homologous end-joining factor 1 [Austrofundulus limnaeus]